MRDTSRNAIAAPGFGVRLLRSLGLLLALAVAATGAWAQEDEMPGRVGRVADIGGAVFVAPADRASEWVPAEINYPVATGDNLWVSGEGRAEIDFGGGQFRLAGDTNVNVSRLSEREFALFVAQGRLIVRVRALDGQTETHLLYFPDEQAFDAFRSDPARLVLADEWKRCGALSTVQLVERIAEG